MDFLMIETITITLHSHDNLLLKNANRSQNFLKFFLSKGVSLLPLPYKLKVIQRGFVSNSRIFVCQFLCTGINVFKQKSSADLLYQNRRKSKICYVMINKSFYIQYTVFNTLYKIEFLFISKIYRASFLTSILTENIHTYVHTQRFFLILFT